MARVRLETRAEEGRRDEPAGGEASASGVHRVLGWSLDPQIDPLQSARGHDSRSLSTSGPFKQRRRAGHQFGGAMVMCGYMWAARDALETKEREPKGES